MAAKTVNFKSAGSLLGKTIGQSLSMIGGKDVSNYSLLFMDPTADQKRGEHLTIFMPHIVLGRSARCHVRYSDEYSTVSREHASITIDGSQYILHHNPSASNPTYVNGRVVGGAYALQNGDEIQLSSGGPKVRFNVSSLKSSTIGITNRIGMAMSQAVKPYRTAIWILGGLLILSISLSGWNTYKGSQKDTEIKNLENIIVSINKKIDSLKQAPGDQSDKINALVAERGAVKTTIEKYRSVNTEVSEGVPQKSNVNIENTDSGDENNYPLRSFEKDIYVVQLDRIDVAGLGYDGSKVLSLYNNNWSGTGFLTEEGKFITARHVLEGWKWFEINEDCTKSSIDPLWMELNKYALKGDITVTYKAFSPTGDVFTFTNKMIKIDDSSDRIVCNSYKQAPWSAVHTDWASIDLPNRRGLSSIQLNRNSSTKLKKGTRILISGYANGEWLQGGESVRDLDPLFAMGSVSQDDLTEQVINVSWMNVDRGHSGSPVFVKNNKTGEYEVVGIVSGTLGKIGRVVPVWYVQ